VRFKLVNLHKPSQLNCFMNAILQTIWNVDCLRQILFEFTQAKVSGPGPETIILQEIQSLFNDAQQQHTTNSQAMLTAANTEP
jgi:hypothetical protein